MARLSARDLMDVGSGAKTDHFQTATTALVPSSAAAGLLVTQDGRYLLQLREQNPHIWYPGHWGLFGGAVDSGETAEAALHRELKEELGLVAVGATYFARFGFDFSFAGGTVSIYREFYEVPLSAEQLDRLVLNEGAAMRAFSAAELLALDRQAPYDAFAIWLHVSRSRVRPVAAPSP